MTTEGDAFDLMTKAIKDHVRPKSATSDSRPGPAGHRIRGDGNIVARDVTIIHQAPPGKAGMPRWLLPALAARRRSSARSQPL